MIARFWFMWLRDWKWERPRFVRAAPPCGCGEISFGPLSIGWNREGKTA